MNRTITLVVLAMLTALASPAKSQENRLTTFLSPIGNSTSDRGIEERGAAFFEISALQDSGNATIKAGRTVSEAGGKDKNEDKKLRFSSFIITASAPIDESNDATQLATLDGLRNAFTVSTKYTRFTTTGAKNPAGDLPRLEMLCVALQTAYHEQTGKSDVECDTDNYKKYLPGRYAEYKSLFYNPDNKKHAWGFEPKIGYKKFDFIKKDTIEEKKQSEIPWSFHVFGGFSPKQWKTLISFGAEYQHGFKEADSGTVCPPSSTGGNLTCKTGALGEPTQEDAKLLYVEFRRRIMGKALSLKVTNDFEKDILGVDLPVYLMSNKEGSLTGGIRTGWTEDEKWQFGLFVGSAFSLF